MAKKKGKKNDASTTKENNNLDRKIFDSETTEAQLPELLRPLDKIVIHDFYIDNDVAMNIVLLPQCFDTGTPKIEEKLKRWNLLDAHRKHPEIWNAFYLPFIMAKVADGTELLKPKANNGTGRMFGIVMDPHDNIVMRFHRSNDLETEEIVKRFHISQKVYSLADHDSYTEDHFKSFELETDDFPKGHLLFREIRHYIEAYVDIEPHKAVGLALWVMGSHVFRIFHAYPYLFLHSHALSGKSRCQRTLSRLCRRSHIISCPTLASIFRTVDAVNPTLFLDDIEEMNQKERMDMINMLNVGYEQGAVIPRINPNTYKTEFFKVYCPKCLASTQELSSVLMTRAFMVFVPRTLQKDKFKEEPDPEIGADINLRIMFWAVDKAGDIYQSFKSKQLEGVYDELMSNATPRLSQISKPLLHIAQAIDLKNIRGDHFDLLKQFMEEQDEIATGESVSEMEVKVFNALYLMTDGGVKERRATTAEILDVMTGDLDDREFKYMTPKRIGYVIRKFGIRKKRGSAGMKYTITGDQLLDIMKRYAITPPDDDYILTKKKQGFF